MSRGGSEERPEEVERWEWKVWSQDSAEIGSALTREGGSGNLCPPQACDGEEDGDGEWRWSDIDGDNDGGVGVNVADNGADSGDYDNIRWERKKIGIDSQMLVDI